jgi:protein-tyrosine-phosphatase
MPSFDFTKTKFYVLVGTFATVIPLLTFFEVPFPRFAWAVEVEELEESQLKTAIDLYSRELSKQRYENLKLQREQKKIENEENQIPDSYLKEQEYLESDIKEIEEKIQKASNRLLELKK